MPRTATFSDDSVLKDCTIWEKINLLGPWVHGRFDLGGGVVIESPNAAQQRRLEWIRDALVAHLVAAGYSGSSRKLTLLDIGCNAGFFTMELQRRFGFQKAVGIDPRERNIRKARFVQQRLRVPGVEFRTGDVFSGELERGKCFDVVLFLGVLYHLDDPVRALRVLHAVTEGLLLLETSLFSAEPPRLLPLWPQPRGFELLAVEYEEAVNDGSVVHPGIVQWPTLGALRMMLEHEGFDRIDVLRDGRTASPPMSMVVVAARPRRITGAAANSALVNRLEAERREREWRDWAECLPLKIARYFFRAFTGAKDDPVKERLPDVWSCAVWKLYRAPGSMQRYVRWVMRRLLRMRDPAWMFSRFRFAPRQRSRYEYSRALFAAGMCEEAAVLLTPLFQQPNVEWEIVYKTHFLDCQIQVALDNKAAAKKSLRKSLFANPDYTLALDAAAALGVELPVRVTT